MWFLVARSVHSPVRSSRRLDRWWPWLIGTLVALCYGSVGLHNFTRIHCGMDLAIFDQAVRALSRGQLPTSAMKSIGMDLWGDHFHPVLVLLAPLYWVWDDPRMLLLAQGASIGLATTFLARTAVRLIGGRGRTRVALALALCFATGAGVQFGAVFDVHEVAFGMPVLALALAGLLERRWRAFAVWSCALLLVKEDAGLLVFGLGVVAALRGRRLLGGALCATATAWTYLVITIVIPALSPNGRWAYAGSVAGPGEGLHRAVSALVTPDELPRTVILLLAATGFLALRSTLSLAVLPGLAARAASGNPAYTGVAFHYNLLPAVVLGFAALDVLAHHGRGRLARRGWAAVLVVIAAVSAYVGPARAAVDAIPDAPRVAAAREALSVVPAGAPVAADVYLTPWLTRQHPVTQQVRPSGTPDRVGYTDDIGLPIADAWIVLDRDTVSQGGGPRWVPAAQRHFEEQGWRVVHDRGGFVVLHR